MSQPWFGSALRRIGFDEMLRLPKLAGARFAKLVEGAGANHRFQFFRGRSHPVEEIRQRGEHSAFPCLNHRIRRAGRESFHPRHRHTDGVAVRNEGRTGFVDRRRQEFQSEPMTFQHVDQRVIEAFAVGQHRRHELRRIVALEPRRLIRLNAVGRAVRLAEGVTGKARHQSPDLGRLLRRMTPRKRRGEELPRISSMTACFCLFKARRNTSARPGGRPAKASQICRMCSS